MVLLPADAPASTSGGARGGGEDGVCPEEDASQRLLGCAVHECDHRLDIDKHCQLVCQADLTQLFPVSRLDSAVRRELRAGGKPSLGPGSPQMGRDYTALSGELQAFWGSTGPYTLAEIYSCFGFSDKLNAIKIRADQVLFSTVRSPGAGLATRQPKEEHSDLGIWTQRLPPPDLHAEAADEEALQQRRSWWEPPAVGRLQRLLRAGASLLATDACGQTPLHVLCESAVLDVRLAAAKQAAPEEAAEDLNPSAPEIAAASGGALGDALAVEDVPAEVVAALEDTPLGAAAIAGAPADAAAAPEDKPAGAAAIADAPAATAAAEAALAVDGPTASAPATASEAALAAEAPVTEGAPPSGEGAGEVAAAVQDNPQNGEDAAEAGAATGASADGLPAADASGEALAERPSGGASPRAAEASVANAEKGGLAVLDSSAIALAMLKEKDKLDTKALQELFAAFTSDGQPDPFQEFCEKLRLLQEEEGEAVNADASYADLVAWCCREAPLSVLAGDAEGRTPLCILTGAAGAGGCQAPNAEHLVPPRTLRALCAGLGFCFSACPAQLLHVARHSESFRDAAEASAVALKAAGGDPVPAPLLRALEWIEVAMGGAWEVAEDEWRYGQRALHEGTCPDVEELMNSAIRLNRICEQIEKKTSEWRAEEAALKLCEFKSRCAQKARQYEDRIAKLEAEIDQRARSLQKTGGMEGVPLSVHSTEKAAVESPPKDGGAPGAPAAAVAAGEDAKVEDESTGAAAQRKLNAPTDAPGTVDAARDVVRTIRQQRLVDCDLSGTADEVKQGLSAIRRSLCAAVERLATDLYADQCHCFWELIQNADDNKYADGVATPSLDIQLCVDDDFGAYVLTVNNEIGLRTSDVHAICDVNASLKGAGQTGHKGIGWKSVFRVSDCPHVLSHNFSFKFHVDGPLGKLAFVTPTALTDEEHARLPEAVRVAQDAGCTVMFLPLRCKEDAVAVEAELRQIAEQHLCLVFLRRLHRITLGFPDGTRTRLERKKATYASLYFPDASTAGVKITSMGADGNELRHFMPEFVLHNHRVTLPSGESPGDLTLAFPAQGASGEDDDEVPVQPLFTFLPVRVLGFRFAIQGPFDLTADRGNLHGKSARNRALCTAVPKAFVGALRSVPQLRSNALSFFGQETPEALWLAIRGQMLDALHDVECIPTEPDGKLAAPDECLLSPEAPRAAEAAQHLPPEVLWACCRRRVVRASWAAKHRVQLQRMKVTELGLEQWLAVLRGVPAASADEEGQAKPAPERLVQQAAENGDAGLFRRVFALLGDVLGEKPEVLERLQDLPLLPGCGGRVLRLADGPVYSGFAAELAQPWQHSLEAVGAIRVLDPVVMAVLDAPGKKFLELAGIVKPAVADVLALAAEWHLYVSKQAARRAEEAAALRLAKAQEEERRAAEEQAQADRHSCPAGHESASGASEGQAALPAEASSGSVASSGRGFSGALAERISAAPPGTSQWDRELLVAQDVGPLGLRFSTSSSVVSDVEKGSWADGQGMQAGDELIAFGTTSVASMDRLQLRRALSQRPLKVTVRPRRFAQHRKVDLRLEWPEEMSEEPAAGAEAKKDAAAAAEEAAAKEEARRRRPKGFWDAEAAVARKRAAASSSKSSAAADPAGKASETDAAEKAAAGGEDNTEEGETRDDETASPEADAQAAEAGAASAPNAPRIPAVPKAYPEVALSANVSAIWSSLACLRSRFFAGDKGVVVPSCGRELSWAELGSEGLVVPTGYARRGFGPAQRLTCPTYLGETAGGELTQDVLVAITRFVHGSVTHSKDSGIFADVPPPVIGTPLADKRSSALAAAAKGGGSKQAKKAEDLLEWEAFFDKLGMQSLSPCSRRQQVAGTVLTADLGLRLSSAAWWKKAARSTEAFAYLSRRLAAADRVELCWLRSLRAQGCVDVSQLFLRGPFLRYGGSFLPYLDIHDISPELRSCLQRLGVATTVSGKSLRECLRVLEKSGDCFDVGVYADIYAALNALPQSEQESSVTGEFGRPAEPFRIFVPPKRFTTGPECVWGDGGQGTLRWLTGLEWLQPVYSRFGGHCKDWLVGPHCGVARDLNSIGSERFLAAIRRLVDRADAARHLPTERLGERLEGPNSPIARGFLAELQQVAVQAYRHLAKWCDDSTEREARQLARGSVALAFQQEALIILTDKDWLKPKRVKAHEAYWEVSTDLAGTKAERLALKNRYDPEDHQVLRKFFVHVVGIPEMMSREDLQARLRVPFDDAAREELTAWHDGFSLGDFEEVRSVRQGPGVLGDGSGLFEDLPPDEVQGAMDAGLEPGLGGLGAAAPWGGAAAGGGVAPGGRPPPMGDAPAAAARGRGSFSRAAAEAAAAAANEHGEGGEQEEQPPVAQGAAAGDGAAPEDGFRSAGSDAGPREAPSASEPPTDLGNGTGLQEADQQAPMQSGGAVGEEGGAREGGAAAELEGSRERVAPASGDGASVPPEPASRDEPVARGGGAGADLGPGEASDAGASGSEPSGGDERRQRDAADAGRRQGADPEPPGPEPGTSSSSSRTPGDGGGQRGEGSSSGGADAEGGGRRGGAGGSSGQEGRGAASSGGGGPGPSQSGGASSSRGSRKVRREDYERLLRQLREAEERLESWNQEVETVRHQLQDAEERRDKCLKVLKACYERDYARRGRSQASSSDGR